MKRRSATRKAKLQAQKDSKVFVHVSTKMWTKDSHGLFDYQASEDHYVSQTQDINTELKVFRDIAHNKNNYISKGKNNTPSNKCIAGLEFAKDQNTNNVRIKSFYSNQGYLKDVAQFSKQTKLHLQEPPGPFIVINEYKKNGIKGFPLVPGNIIKLGRVQFLVLEYRDRETVHEMENKLYINQVNGTFRVQKKQETQPKQGQQGNTIQIEQNIACKICLENQNQEDNPLISPCRCKGSCEFLHLQCLKNWINSKVKKQLHGLVTSYNFTKFECQICKTPFPNFVENKGEQKQMMTIQKPNKPYIILQNLPSKSQNKQQKCLHLITVSQNSTVKIGRGHQSQIRVSDISVSRAHAEIVFQNDQYYIRDTNSKFGTLVSFTEDQVINLDMPSLKLQYGRTVFNFQFKEQAPQVDTE